MCSECGWSDFVTRVDEVLGTVNEVSDSNDSDAAQDFCAGVSEKLLSMQDWASESEHVTEKMVEAVENMEAAAGRWLR